MNAVNQRYLSKYGWSIYLPPDWEPLPSSAEGDELVVSSPEVFAWNKDWTVSMTWMLQIGAAEPETVSQFETLTLMEGPISPSQTQAVLRYAAPSIGEITSAEVVRLGDGSRAVEIEESFYQDATQQQKKGYQMVMAVSTGLQGPVYFQRLCFYAPVAIFDQHIYNIRLSARSFRYERPFGLPEAPASEDTP